MDFCGASATIEQDPEIDQRLKRAGAELIYNDVSNDNSYNRFVYLKCTNKFKPRITFFGLDIFDYKIWLLLYVVFLITVIFFKLKK